LVDIKLSMFFDRASVQRKVKDGTKSVLARAGAFVRRTAKGLIRPGKKPAKPGNAPHSHLGLLKQFIFFGYDERTESVVIGPALLNGKSDSNVTVPELLEFGGEAVLRKDIYVTNEVGRDARGKFVTGGKSLVKAGTHLLYHKFPFMAPAMEQEAPKFPQLFSDAVK
jgi:hypothetical protein